MTSCHVLTCQDCSILLFLDIKGVVFCILPNSFPCLQYQAKAHPNRNLLNRLVYDTTSWKFILALLWCSTLPMQWWWFVCPTTYLWILDRQLRGPQVYLQSRRGFKIFHLNVRSITHKMDSIRLLLKDNNLDVLTVSETWLSPKVTDTEITFPGY